MSGGPISADTLPRPAPTEATTRPAEARPQPSPADLEAQARAAAERAAVTDAVETAAEVAGPGEGLEALAAGAVTDVQSETTPADTPIASPTRADRIPRPEQPSTDVPITADSTAAPEPITTPAAPVNPIDRDPRFRALVEAKSLQYLQSQDSTWFNSRYSGVAPSGYLIDKAGNETNFLPSQNIGAEYVKMEAEAREEFARLYPDAVPAAATTASPVDAAEPTTSPVDVKSVIQTTAADIKVLWPNLTAEQIAADPILAHIAEDYGGDIDKFMQAREDWHRTHGSDENYMNSDISSVLNNIKHSAINDIGQDRANQILAAQTSENNAGAAVTPESARAKARANLEAAVASGDPAAIDAALAAYENLDQTNTTTDDETTDQVGNAPAEPEDARPLEVRLDELRGQISELENNLAQAQMIGDRTTIAEAQAKLKLLSSKYSSLLREGNDEFRQKYAEKIEAEKKKKSLKRRLLDLLKLSGAIAASPAGSILSDLTDAATAPPRRGH